MAAYWRRVREGQLNANREGVGTASQEEMPMKRYVHTMPREECFCCGELVRLEQLLCCQNRLLLEILSRIPERGE